MKNSKPYILKASGLVLLAFLFLTHSKAQELKSLSGANSPTDDTNPVWIGDNTLLFTRAFHPMNLGGVTDPGDIWETRRDESGAWGVATHRADLSTKGYDVALGLEDALTLLVIRNEAGISTLHQYSKFGQEWNYLRKIDFPDLGGLESPVTGRVVEGGRLLFLAGRRQGGLGNEDIYISEKLGVVEWSPLKNLGTAINGFGQETGPYFDPKTQQLYFASNSLPGSNGRDILISKKLSESWDSWSKPERWDQINTNGSEASITFINEKEIVWTSTQNSDGFADLMTFATPVPLETPSEFVAVAAPVAPVKAVRTRTTTTTVAPASPVQPREETVAPKTQINSIVASTEVKEVELPATFLAIDGKNKLELAHTLDFLKGVEVASFEGPLLVSQLKNEGITSVKVSSPGYFPRQLLVENINPGSETVVLLTKAEAGSMLLLENVNFKRGTAELEGESTEASLSDLAKFLVENPQVTIRINGHTDNVGDPGLNKQLSLERAGSVRDFLVKKGVNFEKLRISGWGGTRPIASNATEAGRAKNRRVELAVE
jgi:outer membrane protein OmpA-like peptidoglycan-associated protein